MTTLILRLNGAPQPVRLGENTAEAIRQAGLAAGSAAVAQAWAEGTTPGGAGTESAKEHATEAAVSAAVAQVAAGPNYTTTAAGLGATATGQAFAVDNGNGVITVYRHDAGPVATALRSYFSNPFAAVAARTDMAALAPLSGDRVTLSEGTRRGEFIFSSSNVATKVAADTAQGIYIAPSSDPTGASGAWKRVYDGALWFHWFGAVEGDAAGANAAANDAAWNALYAVLVATRVNHVSQWAGLPKVCFGLGTYEKSTVIEIKDGTIEMAGMGRGHGIAAQVAGPTRIKCYNTTGILIQDRNTSGTTTKDGVNHDGAQKCYFHDFDLEGNFSGTEAEYYGIHGRAAFIADRINIHNFAGDGFYINADTTTTGGNAGDWRASNCDVWNNRDAMYLFGNNVGGGVAVGCHFIVNRRWGINSADTVGCTWLGIDIGQNGFNAENDGVNIPASMVSYSGNRYGSIAGQSTGAATNAPSGTTADNTWWYYIGAGGVGTGVPAWFSGISVRSGGPVRANTLTARNAFSGCYAENSATLRAQIWQEGLVVGGYLADTVWQNRAANCGTGLIKAVTDGTVHIEPNLEVFDGTVTTTIGASRGNTPGVISKHVHATISPSGNGWLFDSVTGGNILLTYGNSNAVATYQLLVTGVSTTTTFSRAAAVPHATYVPRFFIGDTLANARQITNGTAAPATSAGQGDFVLKRNPVAGELGWNCITGGVSPTWQQLWAMTAAKQSAFAAWTGTANRAAKDTATATLVDVAQTVKALVDDLKARGVLN